MRYLFRAYFADGETFDQSEDDTARLPHDRIGQGSSYTDLLWLIEHEEKRVAAFALCEHGEPVAAAHLDTGVFEIGGNQFYAGQDGLDPGVLRKLMYFRQVTRERTQAVDTTTGEPIGDWAETVYTRYYIGWQTGDVQQIIGIDG